jgi:hypothetical protein
MPEFTTISDFALTHLPLTLFALALVFVMLTLAVMPKPHSGVAIIEVIFRSYLFWVLLLLFLRDTITLGAFGPNAAASLGSPVPAPDPQAANASLAFAVITSLALSGSIGLRVAAVVSATVIMLAPFAGVPPTTELAAAHLPEVSVVAVGILLLLLQWGGSLGTANVHQMTPPASEPPRPTTHQAAPA